MGYRVLIGGVPIECDSMEEAMALAERAAGVPTSSSKAKSSVQAAGVPPGSSRWSESRVRDFFSRISGNQKKLIDELLDHQEGRTDQQLIAALSNIGDNRGLAGVFAGVWKNAKKVGADPNDVYHREQVTIADKQQNEYSLSPSFRSIAMSVRNSGK